MRVLSEPPSGAAPATPSWSVAEGGRTAAMAGSVDCPQLATLACFFARLAVDGRLSIRGEQWNAELLFAAGHLIQATCGPDRGRRALEAMWLLAAQSTGSLRFTFGREDAVYPAATLISRDELAQSLGLLSSETFRLTSSLPTLDFVVHVASQNLDRPGIIVLTRTALAVLVQVDGRTPIAQLTREHGHLATLSALVGLIDLGLVVLEPPMRPSPGTDHSATRSWPRTNATDASATIVQVGGWTALGTVLGGVTWFAPALTALALGAVALVVPLAYGLWRRAEFGLLGLLALSAGLLRGSDLYVPLPLGGLYPADVALLLLLAVVSVRALFQDGLSVAWLPVSGPLLAFLVVCGGSATYAVAVRGVALHQALNELRPLAFYGVAVLTTLAVTRPKHLTALLFGLFVLADVIAAALVLQQFAGAGNKLLPGMDEWQVNQVGLAGATDVGAGHWGFGFVRIVPPASLLLFFLMVFAFVRMLTGQRFQRLLYLAQFAFLNLGLLLTYTRAQWIASVLALGLSTCLLPSAARWRLVRAIPPIALVAGLCITPFAAGIPLPGGVGPFVTALVSRATSTLAPSATLSSPSLQWRVFETEQALHSLAVAPQGVGLGNTYRPVTTLAGEAAGYQGVEPLNRFVHNSYLYIAVKTGLLGLAVFAWFCLAFVANSWRLLQRLPEGRYRWLTLAAMASFVGIMQWSLTEANFMQSGSTVVVGLMVGIVACAARAERAAQGGLVRGAG